MKISRMFHGCLPSLGLALASLVSLASAETLTFSNTNAITIPDSGPATPYPSTNTVSGIPPGRVITRVTVRLHDVTHPSPSDLDVLLVAPLGQSVILMGRAGSAGLNHDDLTFSDCGRAYLPVIRLGTVVPTVGGLYRPSSFGTMPHVFPPPAPAGGPTGNGLEVFGQLATEAEGLWSLYVVDNVTGNSGGIAGGWSMTIHLGGLQTASACSAKLDFDGDGQADVGLFRPTTGEWLVLGSRLGPTGISRPWGSAALGDRPIPGDYDGDGVTDLAVYRASTGEWFVRQTSDFVTFIIDWGAPALGDIPVPADYDGDGITDVAVYRNSTGEWFIRQSSDGMLRHVFWGAPLLGDVPLAAR